MSRRVDPGFYRARRTADARSLACANLGDALRVVGSHGEAERLLGTAEDWLALGTGRLWVSTVLARLQARLLQDLGDAKSAHKLLQTALAAHVQREISLQTPLSWLGTPGGRDSGDDEELPDELSLAG